MEGNRNMAKLDELVNQVKEELLEKEIDLIELDDKIKETFKTKNSIFSNVKDWTINYSNEFEITYCYHLPREHLIYITFIIDKFEHNKTIQYVKVKLINVQRF